MKSYKNNVKTYTNLWWKMEEDGRRGKKMEEDGRRWKKRMKKIYKENLKTKKKQLF